LARSTYKFAGERERWAAVQTRNSDADDHFFYAVKTTGIYCRPSCSARLALQRNVVFYVSSRDAEEAGFRPCKKCRPNEPKQTNRHTAAVTKACRIIEQSEQTPSLEFLAKSVAISPWHFHRIFKSITGLTPKAYGKAHRSGRVRELLPESRMVTDVIYDAGYNSNGRFYAETPTTLGMTPTAFRAGGKGENIQFAIGESHLGSILVAASAKGVCAIFMGDNPDELARDLQNRFPNARLNSGDDAFNQWVAKVVGFVEAPELGLDLPLDIRGTAFQQRVWQALSEIPAGSTISYGELARKLGAPKSARAIAGACAANTLAVAIPCHRVVRTDGSLSGYRWGVERKRQLLEKETTASPKK